MKIKLFVVDAEGGLKYEDKTLEITLNKEAVKNTLFELAFALFLKDKEPKQ